MSSRIQALARLGEYILENGERLQAYIHRTWHNNLWFTPENQTLALESIAHAFLDPEKLLAWNLPQTQSPRTVGMIFAGNIPLVGFHDWLAVYLSGHRALVKLSEKDRFLFPHLLEVLSQWDPQAAESTQFTERLAGFEAVIATGSDNSSRYFEAYFGKYPHIIRKNRNGVGVLEGTETPEELHLLGKDVFQYFGLGCRNVAKLYLPRGYDLEPLLEALHEFNHIILHEKYRNNFDYNNALYMLNRVPFRANGCVIMVENPSYASRIACLHYEFYENAEALAARLRSDDSSIQCVVGKNGWLDYPLIPFGQSQTPSLTDYPDGADLGEWLKKM